MRLLRNGQNVKLSLEVDQHVDNHSLNSNFVYSNYNPKHWINIKYNVFLSVMFIQVFLPWHAHLGERLLLKPCKARYHITEAISKWLLKYLYQHKTLNYIIFCLTVNEPFFLHKMTFYIFLSQVVWLSSIDMGIKLFCG